ncbi:MAG TPA: LptF/LptG family permease [Gemmataceae bacterium]|nr:LptF/LptG family permease [Gemmataceae bacterium]
MHLLDRMLIRGYLKAYVVCLVSLLSLYVVIDLFTNVDDFAEQHRGLAPILKHVGVYYGYKVAQIFDLLCEAIVLLAAMFTVAWMQRNNELLPLLSAGIPTQRVVRPVLLSATAMLGLTAANQELVLPRIATYLLYPRDDPNGEKEIEAHNAFEPNGIHITGERASRRQQVVKNFSCLIPESLAGNMIHLNAKEAYYFPPREGPYGGGGWLLTGTQPAELEGWNNTAVLRVLDSGKFFLYTKEADFEAITRNRTWFSFAATHRLFSELNKPDSMRLASMAVRFHMRLTRPILGLLLVFMGLSVILRDQNRNVYISTALCLVLCGLFFGACFACRQMGDNEYLSPALAAWLPVLVFGPLAFVLFDAIHT